MRQQEQQREQKRTRRFDSEPAILHVAPPSDLREQPRYRNYTT
jgi:hypothetical protein